MYLIIDIIITFINYYKSNLQIMKKLLLLCVLFVFSSSFYAQETTTKAKKPKAKTEKVDKSKAPKDNDAAAKKAAIVNPIRIKKPAV